MIGHICEPETVRMSPLMTGHRAVCPTCGPVTEAVRDDYWSAVSDGQDHLARVMRRRRERAA